MLGEMKFDRKIVKNYFDDIVGGAGKGDWESLRRNKRELLERCRSHGWKLKPKKEFFGFEELEIVGHVFREGSISVPRHRIDALQRLRYPENATTLKSLLGLANTFRDRVPGFSMRVPNLTALTRMKGKLTLSPEAIAEVDHLKEYLQSPAVLMCFRPGRETFVYTDASVGFHDIAGGLGAVITQVVDGSEYVCAYASATLSPAQKNYHIARLEALAFVWICGKFNNWMQAQEITWRNDSRANKFIQDTKFSHNPALCRYALQLQQFKYKMEWVPGVKLIADPLSRLVVIPTGSSEAFTLPEIVFGKDLGQRVFYEKHAPSPGRSLQLSSLFQRETGVTNRWIQRVQSDYETLDGEPFEMYVLCEFISASAIPVPKDGEGVQLSPLRTADPAIRRSADDTKGARAVSPVQLSHYDKELLNEIGSCRRFLLGEESLLGRRRKLMKRLVKGMSVDEDVLWKEAEVGRVRVIEDMKRFEEVMREIHDGMGHRQLRTVIGYFTARYWVPAAAKLIETYIRSCETCQRYSRNNVLHAPGYSPRAVDIFAHWSIDFAGPFPEDMHTGARYIIIAVDFLTRWVEAKAVKSADAATASTFIYEDIVCRYGTPECLQSDNGTHFINEVIESLNKTLKIHHRRSTPYYPQSNGRVERVVGTLKANLKRAVDGLREDDGKVAWVGSLAAVLWVYRCTPHSTTKVSPAFLVFGSNIRIPIDGPTDDNVIPETSDEHRELVAQRIRFISDVIPGIRDERRTSETRPNADAEFHVGDLVWLRETKYDGKELCPVFAPRWTGPFQVWEVWDKGAYRLRSLPKYSGKQKPTILRNPVNANRLRQYVEREWKLGTGAERQ
jgi:transposase InsO family protein